jgi:hypothetical protein
MDITGLFAYMSEPWTLVVIVIASVAAFIVGGIWYSPKVFAPAWMREVGMTDADHKEGSSAWAGMAKMYGLTFVQAVFLTIMAGPSATAVTGAILAALIALGFVSPMLGINAVAERRTCTFFLINAGYAIVSFAVMGAVIGWLL